MEIVFALIPLSLLLIGVAVLIFKWAVKSGQFDDLEGPAYSILFENDKEMIPEDAQISDKETSSQNISSQTDSPRRQC